MNLRLIELESQCWEPRQYGPAWFNSEKFAELIVRECAEITGCNGHVSGFTLSNLIKEHFGIKE